MWASGGGGLKISLVLALVQNYGLGFGFGLGPSWTTTFVWTQLLRNICFGYHSPVYIQTSRVYLLHPDWLEIWLYVSFLQDLNSEFSLIVCDIVKLPPLLQLKRFNTWISYPDKPALQRMSRSMCCSLEHLGLVTPCPSWAAVFYENRNIPNVWFCATRLPSGRRGLLDCDFHS